MLRKVPEDSMSLCRTQCSVRMLCTGLSLMLAVILTATVLAAQDEPTPRAEIFTGYQWLDPNGHLPTPFQDPNNPVSVKVPSMPYGLGASFTYNFHPVFGAEVDYGENWDGGGTMTTAAVGPRFTWRSEGLNMFAHALVGLNRIAPNNLRADNAVGPILGGGIDLKIWRPLSIRLIEADYLWSQHHYADLTSSAFPDLQRPVFKSVRLRTGLVWNIGSLAPAVPPTASCSVQPGEVLVGEPVTATATGSNFNPKHTLNYSWNSTGGKVTSKAASATIDTNGLSGGSYTVTAHISDPKMKKGGDASCTANFTVKEPPKNAPTMSCTANPTTVQAGTSSSLSCTCTSPDSVPVTVGGWTASAGTVSGTGNSATLDTTGAPAGAINVSATCTDSRGLTATTSTQVTVENPPPPPPPPPQSSKLSECDFPNKVKPWRVDNTCKAILDDVALRLQRDPEAKLVIVGNAEPTEKRKNLAAERGVNSKAYLSGGEAKQAIDASRIEVRTGGAGTRTAEYWVVPAGASFTGEGTQPVDENRVKAVPDHPAAPKKKAAKPKAQ
jgi:hypothetical protein